MALESISIFIIVISLISLVRMALFLVGSDLYYLQAHFRKRKQKKRTSLPLLTVIIPAHNEENTIVKCARSVTESHYPKNLLQAIVIDDGSTDQTVALASGLKDVTVVSQPRAGKARALNYALHNITRGELVMCLDADSTLAPDAIKNVVRYFDDPRVAAVGSNVKIRNDGSLLALIQQFEYIICHQMMKRAHTFFNVEYIIGGIGSTFRRSMLEKVGYYDTNTLTEDIDLTMKLLQQGNKQVRIMYASDVITETEPVQSINGLIRQRYRWKYGRFQTFFKNLNLFFSRDTKHSKLLTWGYLPYAIFGDLAFFLEPLIVAYILFIVVWYRDLWTLLGALVVMTTYFAIIILGDETLRWQKKVPFLLLTPVMYFLFYALSFVEYVALIKSLVRLHKVPQSIGQNDQSWTHVERGVISSYNVTI
jgi:biofilm PGA synthesis N-glycosyltransferase PgaC